LEDFLRGLARWRWLELQDPGIVGDIPLPGAALRRGQKFTLSDLLSFRGSSVEDVVSLAVTDYLDKSSYNDTSQVAEVLRSCGVETSAVSADFGVLQELMERRHHIVHQADQNPNRGSGHHQARSLSVERVQTWLEAVRSFVEGVCDQVEADSRAAG
jgi:hypothetical protein